MPLTAASQSGPELIDDNVGPMLPVAVMVAMLETNKGTDKKNRAGVRRPADKEHIVDDG